MHRYGLSTWVDDHCGRRWRKTNAKALILPEALRSWIRRERLWRFNLTVICHESTCGKATVAVYYNALPTRRTSGSRSKS